MRARVFRPGEREGLAVTVVAAEAARAMPDREQPMDIPTHGDAEARAGPPARLLGQLQGNLIKSHHIVLADGPRVLLAQDAVELDAVQGNECGGGVGRRVRELLVVIGDELFRQVGIGPAAGGDPRQVEFVDEAPLDGPVEPLTAAAGLGRVGADVLDAEVGEGAADLGCWVAARLTRRCVWPSMPLTRAGSLDPRGGHSCALWQRAPGAAGV